MSLSASQALQRFIRWKHLWYGYLHNLLIIHVCGIHTATLWYKLACNWQGTKAQLIANLQYLINTAWCDIFQSIEYKTELKLCQGRTCLMDAEQKRHVLPRVLIFLRICRRSWIIFLITYVFMLITCFTIINKKKLNQDIKPHRCLLFSNFGKYCFKKTKTVDDGKPECQTRP